MARRTVADQLVSQIIAAGARHVYGIVGDSLNPVVDAVRRAREDGAVAADVSPKVMGSSQVTSTQYHSPSSRTMFQACSSRLALPWPWTVMHSTSIRSINSWKVEE